MVIWQDSRLFGCGVAIIFFEHRCFHVAPVADFIDPGRIDVHMTGCAVSRRRRTFQQ